MKRRLLPGENQLGGGTFGEATRHLIKLPPPSSQERSPNKGRKKKPFQREAASKKKVRMGRTVDMGEKGLRLIQSKTFLLISRKNLLGKDRRVSAGRKTGRKNFGERKNL